MEWVFDFMFYIDLINDLEVDELRGVDEWVVTFAITRRRHGHGVGVVFIATYGRLVNYHWLQK